MGRAIASLLHKEKYNEVRILSRCTEKQKKMQKMYPHFLFIQGDITNRETLSMAVCGCHEVIHTAAMKDITRCEEDPLSAMKVNIDASIMLLEESIKAGVKRVVMVSTDKAVFPSSVMGMTKALMERAALRIAGTQENTPANKRTTLAIIRPGNLLGSAGTVLPIFIKQAKAGKKLTVTDPEMTRFMMTPLDAAEYALFALEQPPVNAIVIKKAQTYSIGALAMAVLKIFSPVYSLRPEKGITITGAKPGEKKSETMCSAHEIQNCSTINLQQSSAESFFFFSPETDYPISNKAFNSADKYYTEGFNSRNGLETKEETLFKIISDYEKNMEI